MIEEVIRLLTHIDNMFCICGVIMIFIFLCILGYAIGSCIDEFLKQRKEKKEDEMKNLKEEIVKDITAYYDNTKEKNK